MGIEQANMALDSGIEQSQTGQGDGSQGTPASADSTFDLDSAGKFKWQGKEWTADQLKKSTMLHSDYTKKAQQLAENRKYFDNLDADLDTIRSNPHLVEQFKQTYPKEFHKYLRYVMAQDEAQQNGQQGQMDPKVSAALQRLERVENYVQEREVQAKEQEIENITGKMSQKYPEAIEDVVLARAQAILENGGELSQGTWEKLYKTSHEAMINKYKTKTNQTFDAQRTANQKGRGAGIGGGTPGQAPKKMSFAEATEAAVNAFKR